MGDLAAQRAQLTSLSLPRRGLGELLRGWSSDGQVYEALGAVFSGGTDIEWSARDIERRAHRVLLGKMEPDLQRLPTNAATWLQNLPVTTTAGREISPRPMRPTNWAASARRYGWPPTAFVGYPRSRVRDETTLRVLAWTARKLHGIVRDVLPSAKALSGRVEPYVDAMVKVVDQELSDIGTGRPDRLDIRSLASSGTPWSALAVVTDALLSAETDLEFLAYEIIEPIPDLQWRLFHLSVLGEVLSTLRDLGGRVRWIAPLSASEASGPQFRVVMGQEIWDLWFEASGASRRYGAESPYRTATLSVATLQRAIGADIMLCLRGKRSLMFECKWSPDGKYVGRDGYHQASSYLVEARSGIADDVWSYVIAPEEVVPSLSEATLNWPGGSAVIGAGNIEHIGQLVSKTVVGDPVS